MLKAIIKKDVQTEFFRRFSSFTYLNITQFLGALNDNIFKLLTVYFCIQVQGEADKNTILAISGAIFVLPFLLFSAFSGSLADRFSKRNIIASTKLFELLVMTCAVLTFYFEYPLGAYVVLFLLATQSAFFGPSKYGILPEIVANEKISQANGVITSFTFVAIIIGTFFASFMLDITGKSFLIAASFCALISIAGVITSFCIEYTPPVDTSKKISSHFLAQTWQALKTARQQPSLLTAIFSSAFFLFLGAFAQLNIIPFAMQSLHLTDTQGGYLFLIIAFGIGIGSFVAGKISGKTVELALVPIAGVGISLSLYLIDFLSSNIFAIVPIILMVGFFGGIFMVPLESYIQIASPSESRGKIVGATNFLSYVGVLLSSFLLYLLSEYFQFEADKGFTVMACMMLAVTVIVTFQYFDYCCRFIGMIISRLHFRTKYHGVETLPDTPAVYVCTHTEWNDTLLMLGAQRRRIRFFVEQEQDHKTWLKQLYRMLRIVQIPAIEPLNHQNSKKTFSQINDALNAGISVCIFVENPDICQEIEKLNRSYSFQTLINEAKYPIIPVAIEKGTKEKDHKFFRLLLEKCRVPAALTFGNLVCDVKEQDSILIALQNENFEMRSV